MSYRSSKPIVHVIYSFRMGGAESVVVDLIRMQSLSFPVLLVVINDEFDEELVNEVKLYGEVILIKRKPGFLTSFKSLFSLFVILLKSKSEIVHCHNHNLYPLVALNIFKKKILTIHTTGIRSFYFRFFNRLVCVSTAVFNELTPSLRPNSFVIENGIDARSIVKSQISHNRSGKFKIVQVSRLVHEVKGQDLLIDAVAHLVHNKGLSIYLDFIGDGPSKSFLEKKVRECHLEDFILFLGGKKRSEVHLLLHNYDLLVQPSRIEGFGITIVEGMMAKIPVLVSDVQAPLDIIGSGDFGYYFEISKVSTLQEAIMELYTNKNSPQQQMKLIKAMKRAESKYGIELMISSYFRVYFS
jgi:glycosyltransferase involved in cell wall biosynthesis